MYIPTILYNYNCVTRRWNYHGDKTDLEVRAHNSSEHECTIVLLQQPAVSGPLAHQCSQSDLMCSTTTLTKFLCPLQLE